MNLPAATAAFAGSTPIHSRRAGGFPPHEQDRRSSQCRCSDRHRYPVGNAAARVKKPWRMPAPAPVSRMATEADSAAKHSAWRVLWSGGIVASFGGGRESWRWGSRLLCSPLNFLARTRAISRAMKTHLEQIAHLVGLPARRSTSLRISSCAWARPLSLRAIRRVRAVPSTTGTHLAWPGALPGLGFACAAASASKSTCEVRSASPGWRRGSRRRRDRAWPAACRRRRKRDARSR
jgi:hypothetical protein